MSCQLANGWERIVGDTVAIPVRITRAETKERVPYVVINSVRRRFMSTMQHLVVVALFVLNLCTANVSVVFRPLIHVIVATFEVRVAVFASNYISIAIEHCKSEIIVHLHRR